MPIPDERSRYIIEAANRVRGDHAPPGLPVDPSAIAAAMGVGVTDLDLSDGLLGFIMRCGDEAIIGCNRRLAGSGQRRFTLGHELGHYCLDDHAQALLTPDNAFLPCAFAQHDNPYEREADAFAGELLMPENLFREAAKHVPEGMVGVEELAEHCQTSMSATANRYARLATGVCFAVMSDGATVRFGILSDAANGLFRYARNGYMKDRAVPGATGTHWLGGQLDGNAYEGRCSLRDWLPSGPDLPLKEEARRLGRYGILTLLLPAE